MFPLSGKTFPTSADELTEAIEGALRDVLTFGKKSAVTADGGKFPAIKHLAIDLSGSTVKITDPPPQPKPKGKRQPGITVDQLEVTGHPIKFEQSKADIALNGKGLTFDFAHDASGKAMLVLTDAKDGKVAVKIGKEDLRELLLAAASAAAKQQGVTIQDLQLDLESEGKRSVSAEARVKAKKMMMSGTVSIRGRVDIDDALVATVSGLACTGEGMIGGMAAGFIQGKLKTVEGQRFPLMAFSLGDVALRDLTVSIGSNIDVTAAFGHKG